MLFLGEGDIVPSITAVSQFGLAGWFAWMLWSERGKSAEAIDLLRKAVEQHDTVIALFNKTLEVVDKNTAAFNSLEKEILELRQQHSGMS